MVTVTSDEVKQIIRQELPNAIATDPAIRDFILQTVSRYYATRTEMDDKFDRILGELQRDREEQAQKWREQNRKWDEEKHEQNRKWDEQNQRIDESLREINQRLDNVESELKQILRRYDSTIGALGARWGLHSEQSFRNALAGILSDSFGVEVINFNEMDLDGTVFGRPDQVEIDVIIKNGLTIVCEIKSSINKGDMYLFERKVEFYAQHQNRTVNRKLVISPMVDVNALPVAQLLGIEVYSYAQDVSDR
jgi:hypothetical protein